MIDLVLATDLARHFEFLSTLRALASEHGAAAFRDSSGGPDGGSKVPEGWRSPFADGELVSLPLLLGVATKWADLGAHADWLTYGSP
jgi:hypothetical protein